MVDIIHTIVNFTSAITFRVVTTFISGDVLPNTFTQQPRLNRLDCGENRSMKWSSLVTVGTLCADVSMTFVVDVSQKHD